ncbi:hypothetical protein GAN55_13350 [Bacteroides thetaiotaomicron]|uniref:Uncharacterized protein n=1 Tax=Bacteroides thetaiotaomicron TaxID=818 RepID=A0A6I0TEQ6_BACT4|nr:hypothetical protein GAN55_13350 [Bacteroides thetaiotaomicron]KAB4475363.1 hypothetical protein GAN91_22030 [Bacteroides thetaiotaomicron]KAB4519319.1 hypothetical protein GAO00_06065 [Bacteroides thetaiotaomicron]
MTVAEAISKYITFRRSVDENFDTEPRIMNLFSKVVGQNTEMSDINRQQCVSFLYSRPSFKHGLTAY